MGQANRHELTYRRTDLAHVRHDARVAPFDCLLQVGVVEDQERGFPARLESDVLQRPAGFLHDLPARCRAPRESDLVNTRMLRKPRACDFATAIDDVDNAGREAGFSD